MVILVLLPPASSIASVVHPNSVYHHKRQSSQ